MSRCKSCGAESWHYVGACEECCRRLDAAVAALKAKLRERNATSRPR